MNQLFLANVDISQNVGFSIRHARQLPPEHENLKPQIESERDCFREVIAYGEAVARLGRRQRAA